MKLAPETINELMNAGIDGNVTDVYVCESTGEIYCSEKTSSTDPNQLDGYAYLGRIGDRVATRKQLEAWEYDPQNLISRMEHGQILTEMIHA